jgi:hypothetical protein
LLAALAAPVLWAQAPPPAAPPPAAPAAAAPAAPAAPKGPADLLDDRIIAEAKANPEVMANLTYLSDMIGPRLTGSPALKRANEWAADKMKSYGLENVRLEPWSIPVGWERGTVTARIIDPDNGRQLLMASLGWTPGTEGKITGDVVVVKARTSADLAQYKGKLKNAIILRGAPAVVAPISDTSYMGLFGGQPRRPGGGRPGDAPMPPGATPPAPGTTPPAPGATPPAPGANPPAPGGNPMGGGPGGGRFDRSQMEQMRAFQRELADFLRAEGAAVMLQDSGKPHGLLVTTGGWRGPDRASAPEPLPTLYVAHEHYALLHRLATRPEPARTRIEIEVSNRFIPGPIVVYNTIGEIRGSEKPDEYVVIGAHLDSWDLGQGTTDNGTGSSVVLEAARVLAKCGVRPKRTIRFCLFTGEEQGLYGSKAFVQSHKDEMARTSLALVHDTGTGKVIGLGTQGREVVKPILEAELGSLKELGLKEINTRGMGGSDHASFEAAGVPGFAFQQDPSEYRLTHHTQTDTLDKAKPEELTQGATMMAVIAMRVANLPELLPRDKPAGAPARRGGE